MSRLKLAGLVFVFIWFFVGGIGHFVNTAFFVSIMPPYIPWPKEVVYLSGVIELILAFALIPKGTRRLAGLALLALIIGVTPVHIYMAQYPERFPQIPEPLLWLRLVIQVLFFACVWWCTQTVNRSSRYPSLS